MITRNPSLTDQVKAHIKDRIVNDDFDDDRIPPEASLGEELGVSRTTIRDALAKLENEGAIYRKQGSGTFVNRPGLQIKSRLEEIWSYSKVLEDHGYTPSVSVISDRIVSADSKTATALDLAVGADVVEIEKLFLEDDEPVVLTCNRIPATLLESDHSRDDLPLYEFLDEYCERRLSYYVSEIVPVAFSSAQARKLGVKRGTVGLAFVEIGYDQHNQPIVHATSHFRDDLLRFRIIRRRTGA
ncbi:MAG: GntR family transcriptional regulator [Acidimicrobiia bacterium]|nr:GntR family transcriptional regulator [Acidimicrobiia bacterium]